MENKYYKPTGRFSPLGAALMAVSTFGVGSLLFILYLYIVGWCPIIYLNIFIAGAISFILGWICAKIIRAYKIRNTLVALICCTIGFLGASYVKWAYYDYRDYYKDFNEAVDVTVEDMKDTTAYEYYELYEDFSKYNGKNFEKIFNELNKVNAATEGKKPWEYYGYDKLLGGDPVSAEKAFKETKEKTAYDFAQARDLLPEKISFLKLMSEPSVVWEDIKAINKEGRWRIGKSYSTSAKSNVNGVVLWIVWIGEFGLLAVFMYAEVFSKSKEPFIESDNEWAIYANMQNIYRFADYSQGKDLKYEMETNPYGIFNRAIPPAQVTSDFVGMEIWHNADRSENYITLTKVSPVKNGNTAKVPVVKYLRVEKEFIDKTQEVFASISRSAPQSTEQTEQQF